MSSFVDESKAEEQRIDIQHEEFSEYPLAKRYGNMKIIGKDKFGEPRFMLGPHCIHPSITDPLFLTALSVCLFLMGVLFYNYFGVFSNFWRVLLVISCGSFTYSYLKVGFSRPGIAHPRRAASSFDREDRRFCCFCELVRERGTEHCEECGVCIEGLDHHCPWVGKCIGRENLLDFYVFLVCTFANMIICFVATSAAAVNLPHGPNPN
jgi:hypothetical protein